MKNDPAENKGLKFVVEMIRKEAIPLAKLVKNEKVDKEAVRGLFQLAKKGEMGLYVFWWEGDEKSLPKQKKLTLRGPKKDDGNSTISLQWELSDFPSECHEAKRYPLYIGKTTKIVNRLSLHLSLRTDRWEDRLKEGEVKEARTPDMLRKHTTSCQFRSGMEHLFGCKNRQDFIDHCGRVSVSFYPFPEKSPENRSDVKERFYLEDLAVGYYRPWFNVDSER